MISLAPILNEDEKSITTQSLKDDDKDDEDFNFVKTEEIEQKLKEIELQRKKKKEAEKVERENREKLKKKEKQIEKEKEIEDEKLNGHVKNDFQNEENPILGTLKEEPLKFEGDETPEIPDEFEGFYDNDDHMDNALDSKFSNTNGIIENSAVEESTNDDNEMSAALTDTGVDNMEKDDSSDKDDKSKNGVITERQKSFSATKKFFQVSITQHILKKISQSQNICSLAFLR